ncbi:MAG: DUF2075 domain-containing protein [Spirochaetia bacterium]|nr:DUF2075 domain-containing protein [Spirochaetia bacterium]
MRQKQAKGSSARMLAGYAWKWTSKKEGNANGEVEDVRIDEFDFAMPWNSRNARSTWAIDDSGINQIGCIHTSQGLEFDYVGVIIGKDLQYDPAQKKLYASWEHYKDLTGKKGLKNDPAHLISLVKNIYKVLLTRAMKGCFIFCHDPKLQEYFRTCLPMREITEQNPIKVTGQKQPNVPEKAYPIAYPLKEKHNSLGEQPAAEEDHPFLKNRQAKNHSDSKD